MSFNGIIEPVYCQGFYFEKYLKINLTLNARFYLYSLVLAQSTRDDYERLID